MFKNFRMGKEDLKDDNNKEKIKFVKPVKNKKIDRFKEGLKKFEFIKRGQLAMLSVTLMVAVAGYINYKYNPEREKDLGQTVYVNSSGEPVYQNVNIYGEKNETKKEDKNNTKPTLSSEVTDNVIEQEKSVKSDDKKDEITVAVFKYDRDNMFSEMQDIYKSVIENSTTTAEKVNEYQQKLSDLVKFKNEITMIENIIKSQGIDDVAIIPTNNNEKLNVIVKNKTELKSAEVAKILTTIVDKLGIKAENISIESKK